MFGLDPDTIRNIKTAFSELPQIEKVILYGSRAKGNYKKGSDIDITLLGKNLNLQTIYQLDDKLDELYLPYTFDISIFNQIDNLDLIDHIKRVGKVFYIKKSGLPQGWEIKKLSELFTIKPPKKLAKEKLNDEDEISFVPMACLNIENKNLSLKQSKQLKDAYKGYTYFADNDVLLAKITPCFENGKVGIAKGLLNGIGFGSSEFIVFRPNGHIVPEYLYYYLSQESFRDEGKNRMVGAVGHKRVSKEFIEEYLLPFPESTEEQKRIVTILDKAFLAIDKAKANAEKNLANAKELFESYLNGIFENPGEDWKEKNLNEISENLDSQRVPITKRDRKSGKIPYYGASGVVDYVADFIFDEDLLCISEDGANLLARTYPIAFSITGKTWVNNHAHILRFKEMTTQKFVELYMNSIKLDDFISGMAQPKLNQTMLNKIPILFPPLEEQESIVNKSDALSAKTKKMESAYLQKNDYLNELKMSILKKAFEGGL